MNDELTPISDCKTQQTINFSVKFYNKLLFQTPTVTHVFQ